MLPILQEYYDIKRSYGHYEKEVYISAKVWTLANRSQQSLQSTDRKNISAPTPIYSLEEHLLLSRGIPQQLIRKGQTIGGQLIRTPYHDCCMKTTGISSRILLHKFIQYFLLFRPDQLGELKSHSFAHLKNIFEEY